MVEDGDTYAGHPGSSKAREGVSPVAIADTY